MILPINQKDLLAFYVIRQFVSSIMLISTVASVSVPTAKSKQSLYLISTFHIVKIVATDIVQLVNKLLKNFALAYVALAISLIFNHMNVNLFATIVEGNQIK